MAQGNPNQNTVMPTAPDRPDIEPFNAGDHGFDDANVSSVLMHLWRRAGQTLTESEAAWVAGAGDAVSGELHFIASLLTDIACLNGELEDGKFPALPPMRLSALLWPLTAQLKTLSSLAFISSEASFRIARPSLYRAGGPFHSP